MRRLGIALLAGWMVAGCGSSDAPAAGSPSPARTSPPGEARIVIGLGPPGTLIVDASRQVDLVFEALPPGGDRVPVGSIVAYAERLPDGFDRDAGRAILLSDTGYVALPLVRHDALGDGKAAADRAAAVFDLGRPDDDPVIVDGISQTFVGDALLALLDGGYEVHQPGSGPPLRIELEPETDLLQSAGGLPLLTADGRELVAVHTSSDGAVDYSMVGLDRIVRPLGATLPPTRLVTGADRAAGSAGEVISRSCDGDPALTVCGVGVRMPSGDQRWRVPVDPGTDPEAIAWAIEGDRVVVMGLDGALYVGRPRGAQKLVDLPPGSEARIAGLTRTHVILSVGPVAAPRLLAVPFGGGGPMDLGPGVLIRVVDPAGNG